MREPNPFIKGAPAPPEFIIGRERQIKIFENSVSSTIGGNPVSLCIYGSRGVGKTTLLRKFEKIVKTANGVAVRVEVEDYDDVKSFCKKLLICLRDELMSISLKSKLQTISRKVWESLSEIEFTYAGAGVKITKKLGEDEAIELFFRKKLDGCWKEIKKTVSCIVFMIDEAEYLEKIGALRVLRNILSRLAEERMKCMAVLSGKLTFPLRMSKEFSPLSRFFHPEKVDMMNDEEIKQLYIFGFSQRGIKVDDDCLVQMIEDGNGHPYVATTIGWYIYNTLPENVKIVSLSFYQKNKEESLKALATELFEPMYEKTPKSEREILLAIAQYDIITPAELAKEMKKDTKKIAPLLPRLEARGAVEKIATGKYKVFHKLFGEYVKERGIKEKFLIPKDTPPVEEYKKPVEKITYYLSLLKDPEIKGPEARELLLKEMRHSIHYFYLKRRVEIPVEPLILEVMDIMEQEIRSCYREIFYDYLSLIANIENKKIQERLLSFLPFLEKELATGATTLKENERVDLVISLQKIHRHDPKYIAELIDQAIYNEKWSDELRVILGKNICFYDIKKDQLEKIYAELYRRLSKTKELKEEKREATIKSFIEVIRRYII